MAKAPSDLAARFLLRMPDGMREKLAAAAKSAGRSMNAEVIARLEASFTQNDMTWELEDRLDRMENFVHEIQQQVGIERGHPMQWYRETDERLRKQREQQS